VKKQHWLEIAEYASLVGSVAGSTAAFVSQQVVYASAPLTLALSLNRINRHRLEQQTRKNTSAAITQVEQRLSSDVQSIRASVQSLPPPTELSTFSWVSGQVRQNRDAVSQIQIQLDQLSHLIKNLPSPFDPTSLKQRVEQLEHVVLELQQQSGTDELDKAIALLRVQMNTLAQRFEHRLNSPELDLIGEIEAKISQLGAQLDALSQKFNTRTEPEAIEQLERMLAFAIQSIQELTNAPVPVGRIEIEASITRITSALAASATKQELDALTQWFRQVTEQLRCAVAEKPIPPEPFNPLPLIAQIENLTERIDNLPLASLQQQQAQAQELIEGLDASAAELHLSTRNLAQMEQQLETVQQLVTVVEERTGNLLDRTQTLDELHQQMPSLQQLISGYAKIEDRMGVLDRLRGEFSVQVDYSVEKRVTELNQLIKTIQPVYEYELVFDRSGSCEVFIEVALEQTQHRLILVCPWPAWAVSQVIKKLEVLLKKNVRIDIGWGRLTDINKLPFGSGPIRQRLESYSNYYSALPKLSELERNYSNQFNLKLLGTHEKFLVCDDRLAMVGSHNFLTSGSSSDEREAGMKTNDPRIVADLTKRFDNADNLELSQNRTFFKPTKQNRGYPTSAIEQALDDQF